MEILTTKQMEEVAPKEVWGSETNFTKWLATDDGIDLLNEALDFEITEPKDEQFASSFKVDVFAREIGSDEKNVVIENQYGETDHSHYGQVLLYAQGLKANKVIWICEEARDEHRFVIEDLNNNYKGKDFYLVELTVIKAKDIYWPKFNVVVKPNTWKEIFDRKRPEPTTSSDEDIKRFFLQFKDYVEEQGSSLNLTHKPGNHSYLSMRMGVSNMQFWFNTFKLKNQISVDLYLEMPKHYETYQKLKTQLDQTEGLEWIEGKNNIIRFTSNQYFDSKDETTWVECFKWYKDQGEKWSQIYKDLI